MDHFSFKPQRPGPTGWQILNIARIPVYVQSSFLIFIGIIFLIDYEQSRSVSQAGLIAFVIFFSLLFHEGGHAVMARLLTSGPIAVSLVAFGGLTTHAPTTRGRNLGIVAAGPACSLALAALARYGAPLVPWGNLTEPASFFFQWLLVLNLLWAVFNLLPIYPMDGGQLLYLFSGFLVPDRRALFFTAIVSVLCCAVIGYLAIRYRFLIALLFVIIFFFQNVQIIRALRR